MTKPFRPLSAYTWNALTYLHRHGPVDRLMFNNGCWDRLAAEFLVVGVQLPSPYKVDRGGNCLHYKIRAAGIAKLAAGVR